MAFLCFAVSFIYDRDCFVVRFFIRLEPSPSATVYFCLTKIAYCIHQPPLEKPSEDIPPAEIPSPVEQPEVPTEDEDAEADKELEEHMDDEDDDDDEDEIDDEKENEDGIAPPSPGTV